MSLFISGFLLNFLQVPTRDSTDLINVVRHFVLFKVSLLNEIIVQPILFTRHFTLISFPLEVVFQRQTATRDPLIYGGNKIVQEKCNDVLNAKGVIVLYMCADLIIPMVLLPLFSMQFKFL